MRSPSTGRNAELRQNNGLPALESHPSLPSPKITLLVVTLSIVAMEVLAITLVHYIAPKTHLVEEVLEVSLMLVLISPVLYLFLFRPVVRHLLYRSQAEALLKQSQEAQLQNMLSASLDGYWMTDVLGNFLEVNNAYCSMSGYSRDELLGMCISDVEAIENPVDTAAHIKQLMALGSVNFETRHRRKDEVILDVEVSANYSNFNGERIFCFLRDISKRKQAEEALHRSEDRLRIALEGSGDSLWELDFQANTIDLSPRYREKLGYEQNEIGSSVDEWIKMIHPDDLPFSLLEMERILAGGTDIFIHERRMRCKDGSWKWMLVRGVVTSRDAVGKPLLMIGTSSDITKRKQAEEALRLQSEITANSAEGISLVRASDGVIVYTNRRFDAMFGYQPGELLGKHVATVNAPMEKSPLETAAEIMRAIEINGIWQGEVQNIKKNGTVFWTFANVSCLPHPEHGLSLLGFHSDITSSKQAEEDLQLAALVYNNSSEAIAVTDADNFIVAVNPAFEKMTGYSVEEVLGKDPGFMSSGRHNQEFYARMWQDINASGYWHGEMWDKRKNGEIYAKALSINAIKNKDGSIHRHVALFSDITERKQSEELIWKQANFDTLTELPNRRMFLDHLQMAVKKCDRSHEPLALLLIDLDHFKEVNDTLGHAMGDFLLKDASARIRSCVRNSDTVARLGGDEFTVILSEIPDNANIEAVTQKIIDHLAEHFNLGNEVAYVSASIGITMYPDDAGNIEDLLKNADQAMYEAKKNGRNRYSYYTQSLQESAKKRMRLTNDLRGALSGHQLKIYFQPIMNLHGGRIYMAEALLRWLHPERGMISPLEFIPLAEESGLIHEIGDWVFKESARWAKRWCGLLADDFQICINKSAVQFIEEGGNFTRAWIAYLEELDLPGKHITVEITESLLLNADAEVTDKLLMYRDAGIQVAIDDFGTGYSSLSYLKKFDIDYLKISQLFVQNLVTDSNDMAVCEAIIVMAHKLGLKVIAEGVETEEQRRLVAQAGCDYAQGFLLSKPISPEELERFLMWRRNNRDNLVTPANAVNGWK